MTDEEHFQRGILVTCEDLHMFATGAADGPLHEYVEMKEYLEKRLAAWTWTSHRSSYDQLVQALVITVLGEVDARFAEFERYYSEGMWRDVR